MFIAFCFAVITGVSFYGAELPIKIKLGSRESKSAAITNVVYPLAFRIENTGKEVIKGLEIPSLFLKGVIHICRSMEKEQQTPIQNIWWTTAHDLQPGRTFESPVVGNILTFFPSERDGEYQVWWTLRGFKSNALRFRVTKGKVLSL